MSRLRSAAHEIGGRPVVVVGAIFAFAALLAGYYTTKITQFEPDEIGYTKLAIQLGDLLQPISTTVLGRDRLNQLYPLTIAPFYKAFGNGTAYDIAHVWNAILMASAAIPAYLLGLQVLRVRAWAYLFSLLVVIAPWLTLSSVQLTEVAALPASVWALWAMQRAMVRPSIGRDVVAFAFIALAAFGRLQLIVLAPVFVIAVFAHELLFGIATRGDTSRRASLRNAWQGLLRGHVLVVTAAALFVFVGVPLIVSGAMEDLFGFYGNTISTNQLPPGVWDLSRSYFVFIGLGIGAVPAALAIGFVVDALVAPGERRTHAFAIMLALVAVALTVQVAGVSAKFTGRVVQERYLMFLAPPLLLGGMALVLEARRPALMTLVGAVPVVLLTATTDYKTARDSFWYMVSPSLTTFYDAIAPRLGRLVVHVDRDLSREVLLAVLIGLVSVAVALSLRRFSRHAVLAALGAMLTVFSLAVTVHAFHRVVYGGGSGPGLGAGTTSRADWVDQALPDGRTAALLAAQIGQTSDAREKWWGAEFWNRKITASLALGEPSYTWNAPVAAHLRAGSGRVAAPQAPKFVVAAARGVPLAPVGEVVARSPDRTLELVKVTPALHARWGVTGISDNGWLPARGVATLYVYGLGRDPGSCRRLAVTFSAPEAVPTSRLVRIAVGHTVRRWLLAPGQVRAVPIVVCGGGRPARVRLGLGSAPLGSVPGVTVQLTRIRALES